MNEQGEFALHLARPHGCRWQSRVRMAAGLLGGLFQTPLYLWRAHIYRLRPVGVLPVGVPSRRIQGGCGLPALSPHTGHPVHNILSITFCT